MSKNKFDSLLKKTIANQGTSDTEKYLKADSIIGNLPGVVDSAKDKKKSAVERPIFSMPPSDYLLIDTLRARAGGAGRYSVTKSEIIRAGLHALTGLQDEEFLERLSHLQKMR